MEHILELMLEDVNRRLSNRELRCRLTPAARQFVLDNAYDPLYGARPLRRYLQHTVETLLSRAVIAGAVSEWDTLTVDVKNGELTLESKEILQGEVVE